MYTFNILNVPNQRFSTIIRENTITISLRTYKGIAYASIAINDEVVESGRRCAPNRPVFSESTNRRIGGTFFFSCSSGEYPSYPDFNTNAIMSFREAE